MKRKEIKQWIETAVKKGFDREDVEKLIDEKGITTGDRDWET